MEPRMLHIPKSSHILKRLVILLQIFNLNLGTTLHLKQFAHKYRIVLVNPLHFELFLA